MKIGIDCGHTLSGADYGAVGIKAESKLTREVGNKVIAKLQSLGHTVVKCYKDSCSSLNDSLSYRTNTANSNNVDLYVSIHFNCFNGAAHGTEVFTYKGKRNSRAVNVLNNIVSLGYANRGIKGDSLYVTNHTKMESMLIECCFCDNSGDMNRFNSENMANAIVKGLVGRTTSTTSSSSSSSSPSSSYGNGKCNYSVKEVQNMLIKIGYPVGRWGADGTWGDGTENAVRCFQRDCNISATGTVDQTTYRRIKAEYNKKMGISTPKPNLKASTSNLYRVRKSWSDSKSQVGAYKDINNAKEECNKHTGYSVFDANGKVVYSKANRSTPEKEKPSTSAKNSIVGQSQVSAEQMAQFVLKNNSKLNITCTIQELAKLFSEEGAKEGIRGDIAFCQAIKETGFFKYGGDVKPGQNNYAGIGATGGGVGGAKFCTPRQGVQAQIQHLKAYANKEALKQSQVDPRFGLVTRGIAPNWEDLNGKWAVPGANYGQEILQLFNLMKQIKIKKVTKAENSSLILYYGDFDKKGAEILLDKINVPYMALRDFKDYNFKTLFNKIYMVGGTEKPIDNCVSFAGKDREDTLQKVLNYVKTI